MRISTTGCGLLALATMAVLAMLQLGSCARVERSTTVAVWEQMDPEEQKLFDWHLEEFRAAHPEFAAFDIYRFHFRVEDLRTQFQTAALAYGGPNLVYGPADQLGPFSIMGLIMPLAELVGEDELARFDPRALPQLDGHVYGLPDQVGNHLTLVANLALVDSIPTDTDSWLVQLDSLTVDENGDGRSEQFGLVFNLLEPFWLVPWLGGFGGWVMNGRGEPTLDTPAMVQALDFLSSLKTSGILPRECDYPLADTLFKEGRAAYIINGPWSWEGYRAVGIEIALAPMPRVSTTGLWPTPMTATKCYAVNRYLDDRTRECTAALLRFLTSEQSQIDLALTLGVLPADLNARARPEVIADPLNAASQKQIEKGRLMPIVPEMRAIWDAMRSSYQSVLNGEMTSVQAARRMQADAVRNIERMKE
jgi:maltose-binding protein MalE